MGTPAPSSGTIDVKPSTLHQVAGGFAGEQTPFDKAAKNLIKELKEYPDAGGYGTAPQAFAASYLKAGNRYLEVWAKAVVSIGGAAVGFATTANNYSKAEAANDASGKTKPQTQPPPVVIDKAPDYGSVPDLKWGDDDGGDDFIRSLLECIPDVVWHLIRPLLEHAFRWGKVAEVYPYPQQHYLNSLSQSWADMTKSLSWAEGNLTGQMYGITQQSNSEWHDAMRQFCSSLWGTTAWGKTTASYEWKHDSAANQKPSHPVMSVLFDTAMKISDLLREFAEAAVYVNGEVWDIYFDAVKKAVGDIDLSDGVDLKDLKEGAKGVGRFLKGLAKGGAELSVEITLNIDTAALNRVVEEYNRRVNALVAPTRRAMEALDEAHRAAPTYAAEEARCGGLRRALAERLQKGAPLHRSGTGRGQHVLSAGPGESGGPVRRPPHRQACRHHRRSAENAAARSGRGTGRVDVQGPRVRPEIHHRGDRGHQQRRPHRQMDRERREEDPEQPELRPRTNRRSSLRSTRNSRVVHGPQRLA